MPTIFIAYPARAEISKTIGAAKDRSRAYNSLNVTTWERPDLGGHSIIAPIIDAIKSSDIVIADITFLNFNVTYELGYALGLGKRVVPIANSSYHFENEKVQKIGILDTLIRQNYTNAEDLLQIIQQADVGQRIATNFPSDPAPLYLILPDTRLDDLSQIQPMAQRAGLRSRVYDPSETPRLGATEAVRSVAVSAGVITPLLSPAMRDAEVHNIRAAFVAGVAHALEKPTLLLRHGDWPAPLDIRDDTASYENDKQLNALMANFAARVHDVLFSVPIASPSKQNVLSRLNLGDPAAENEEAQLEEYFLERGEYRQVLDQRANIVVGRKGSGKTALFVRARDQLRSDRSKIVLDLSPMTHQLKRLKDLVLDCLAAGSKEFLLSAFWDYVLLLEIAGKIIEKDQDVHKRNHHLFEPYQILLRYYREETTTSGVDFSDRLHRLIERIAENYKISFGLNKETALSQYQLTNILYMTTLPDLRRAIENYAKNKTGIIILFDNLDKGWNANGLEPADIVIVRSLLDASRKLENDFRRAGVKFHCTVFLRNDIYDILLSETSDRGKETRILVDWPQASLLKQLVRRRLQYSLDGSDNLSVDALWYRVSVALVGGENSLDYLVRHSLMRPRYLLRLINHCIGSAVNFSREKVDLEDINAGLSAYSTDIVTEIDLEIRDIFGGTGDILYSFLGEQKEMKGSAIKELLVSRTVNQDILNAIYHLLLWHGVIGLKRHGSSTATYIYDVNYDMKRLIGLIEKQDGGDPLMEINPGLWAGLELT